MTPEPEMIAGKFYIRHSYRYTRIVTIQDHDGDEVEYLGYVDEDINEAEKDPSRSFGPFDTVEQAQAADEAWTEGE